MLYLKVKKPKFYLNLLPMITLIQEINVLRITSLLSTGFIICLVILGVALYRNLKLKAENNKLKARLSTTAKI
ncbi:hypothetical protein DMZ48_06515 [Robertkochia solimangrovi]|nr:hypothetical protein DMZ48_06515 [Robertkochia solimangrovi]